MIKIELDGDFLILEIWRTRDDYIRILYHKTEEERLAQQLCGLLLKGFTFTGKYNEEEKRAREVLKNILGILGWRYLADSIPQ